MRLIQENSQFTVRGPLNWYDSAQVRMWIILDINNNVFHHLGRSQMCAGAWYVLGSQNHTQRGCEHNSEKSEICLAMFPPGWNCLPAIRVRRPWQLSHCDIVPCPMSTFMATGNMSDFCNYVFIVPLCNMCRLNLVKRAKFQKWFFGVFSLEITFLG